ncbi:MAG: hypothetical protein ACQSGP_28015 [Frankia sp.]
MADTDGMDRRPSRRGLLVGAAGLAAFAAGGYGVARLTEDHPDVAVDRRPIPPATTPAENGGAFGRAVGGVTPSPSASHTPEPHTAYLLSLFGAPGSFGGLQGSRAVRTVDVPGWGFGPGQSAYMSTVAADGTVFIGTTPFTDDQSKLTGTGMELGVYDPARNRFTRVVVPSSTGSTAEPRPQAQYRGIGGGDVSDVLVVPAAGGGQRLLFASSMPYYGWNVARYGTLPTIGQLAPAGRAGWRFDPTTSWDAGRLAATLPTVRSQQAFPTMATARTRDSRGAAALARLPRSGHVVVAQYFGVSQTDRGARTEQGALFVLDTSGKVHATWQYPNVSVLGQTVVVSPREVVADPTSALGDERFVVTLDARMTNGKVAPFPVQEFSYAPGDGAAGRGTITPKSTAVRAAQDGTRMETACFADDGTLYVARTTSDGLRAAPLAVYPKIAGERGLVRRAPAVGDWANTSWAATCSADYLVPATARGGLVRGVSHDPTTGTILLAGLDGLVQDVHPAGRGTRMTFRVGVGLDLGLNRLRGPATHYVGLRRGCVDATRRIFWLPANQLILGDLPWPFPPFKLDQWLYRIDLTKFLGR